MSAWKKVLFVARIIQAIGTVAREAQSVHYTVKSYKNDQARDAWQTKKYGKRLPTNGEAPRRGRRDEPNRPTNVHANPPKQRYWNDEPPD
jgi:hypothetical protein